MDDLIKRLEEAREGSRELDLGIAVWLGWKTDQVGLDGEILYVAPGENFTRRLPYWSTSLDAALTLVPEGCWWRVFGPDNRGQCEAAIYQEDFGGGESAWSNSPALALCMAALKAREQSK